MFQVNLEFRLGLLDRDRDGASEEGKNGELGVRI